MDGNALASLLAFSVLALIPIVIGSFSSLIDRDQSEKERISTKDATLFPVFGSFFLISFFLLFRFLPREYLNYLITGYFSFFGCLCLTNLIRKSCSFSKRLSDWLRCQFSEFHFLLKNCDEKALVDIRFSWFDISIVLLCTAFTGHYAITKHWVANNLFALGFATTAITTITLETFKSGLVMLGGLFIYDVFWVFGTNVMVTVAKGLEAPIKLLWPKSVWHRSAASDFGMLGVGDVVVPGLFLALCLRFDAKKQPKRSEDSSLPARMPYFTSALVAYMVGLLVTFWVMNRFKAAQPALLYLSPACSFTALATAAIRGELREFWEFSAAPPACEVKKEQ